MRSPARRLYAVLLVALAGGFAAAGLLASRLGAEPWILASVLLVMFVAAAFLLGLPFRAMTRRFDAIASAAQAMAAGATGARAPVDEHDELALLARSLNEAAARTERRIHQLRAELDVSEAVLESLPQGLALLARDLAITHANPRFWSIVGLPPPAVPIRLPAARQPVLEEIARDSIARGVAVTRDVTLYVEGRREYEVRALPVDPKAGTGSESWLLIVEDLRPEKALESLRREFVANASHELKTPLTSIRGYAETLLSGGLDDEENRARFVETIRVQAVRLEALVEDLLELADLERPDAPLDVKDWDVGQIAREMADSFQDVARRSGLALDLEARPGIQARVDRKKIDLALHNLLDNAVKYTDSGRITVEVRRDGGSVRVSVRDTGRGIPEEHLPRLFERFYRVDRGRSRALGGTGLGLSIVKHAALLHGGQVGVESEVGKGSTFWFAVPERGPEPGGRTS